MQQIQKADSFQNFSGSAENFSGKVKVSLLVERNEWRDFNVALVEFSPQARSGWHTHPQGQTLIVTEGEILAKVQGQKASIAKKGDVISCPPGVKHFHGATHSKGAHLALQGFKDGKNVEWLELVSDEEYKQALQEIQE
ncbi:cupin domain-containing protein [Campylobacter sp. MIT 21-1685]|nr:MULTISPECIES: cupin domain-containing protein [unclassified Campylobacter]MCX2683793.1 cupin domain-containing protein [Campylobacter sp. MIT 21-1684]MCX2752074.1 cupin domain-containing protein [Campylobacter sp. MIT 21-1682]MCX2808267.1 cupin domain-containing protein [Campylobacter sp. MIT 21-1685]